jgi:hypothetical protein
LVFRFWISPLPPDITVVEEFLKLRFGWITPTGELIACELYSHWAALGDKYRERYEELVSDYNHDVDRQLNAEQEAAGDDGYYHPAMHRFDAHGDSVRTLEDELYGEGYVRLGIILPRVRTEPRDLEAYGVAEGIERHRELLDFLYDVGEFRKLIWSKPFVAYQKGSRSEILIPKVK